MGRMCCISGCPSGGDAPAHHIPKNPFLFQLWKRAVYSEKMKNMTDEQISKCTVCYRHFADDDYLITFRVRKLKRGIVPSLNLPNRPANYEPNVLKIGTVETSDTSLDKYNRPKIAGGTIKMEVSNTADVALFEDLPDETEFCCKQLSLNNQGEQLQLNNQNEQLQLDIQKEQLQLNNQSEHMKQTKSNEDLFKLYCQKRILRRKKAKLAEQQLELLQYKKQAEQYEKTSTIQKLLSSLTPEEIASVKTKIRKLKYSAKTYVKEYHKIAKQRALGQS